MKKLTNLTDIIENHSNGFFELLKNEKSNYFNKLNKLLFSSVAEIFLLCNPNKTNEDFSKIFGARIQDDNDLNKFRDDLFGDYSNEQVNIASLMIYNAIMMGCNAEIEDDVNKKWLWLSEAHFFFGLGMGELNRSSEKIDLVQGFSIMLATNAKTILRERGKKAALARLSKDPKQKEKLLVRECWLEWRKRPERYKGKAAFARDMLNKYENLTSQKKIEDWCREWEKTPPHAN